MTNTLNIVWFKRDLRLHDHQPLQRAAADSGVPTLLLYIFEPSVMQYYDSDVRHHRFVHESLLDINKRLATNGLSIFVCHNEAEFIFKNLIANYTINNVFSHEEIGTNLTYDRDRRLKKLFKQHGIAWHESQTSGIYRGLQNRKTWKNDWFAVAKQLIYNADLTLLRPFDSSINTDLRQLLQGEQLPESISTRNPNFQPGGETAAGDRKAHV